MGFTDDNRILIEILYIKKLIKLIMLNKLLNYLNNLSVCFASFVLASCDVIA